MQSAATQIPRRARSVLLRRWTIVTTAADYAILRAELFDAVELDLS